MKRPKRKKKEIKPNVSPKSVIPDNTLASQNLNISSDANHSEKSRKGCIRDKIVAFLTAWIKNIFKFQVLVGLFTLAGAAVAIIDYTEKNGGTLQELCFL